MGVVSCSASKGFFFLWEVSGQNAHERGACRFEGAGTERDLSIWKMVKRKRRRSSIPARSFVARFLLG